MKKTIRLFAAVLAIVAAASCQEEINQTPEFSNKVVKNFTMSIDAVQTKTALDIDSESHTGKVNWVAGDVVTIFDGAENTDVVLTALDIDPTDPTKASFQAEVAEADKYYAVYPATTAATLSDAVVSLMEQSGRFEDVSVMAAVSTEGSFAFKNLFGLIMFETASTDIAQISLKGLDEETVAGSVTLSVDDDDNFVTTAGSDFWGFIVKVGKAAGTYYIATPSVEFTKGFRMDLYSDNGTTKIGSVMSKNALSVVAGKIVNLGNIDSHVAIFKQLITNAKELQDFLDYAPCAAADEAWEFANDIDLSGVTLTSATDFAGTLDGKGYSLKNWNCTAPLFVATSTEKTSVIKNINIDASCEIHPTQGNFGPLAGRAYGVVENCHNFASATVADNEYSQYLFGGLVGRLEGKMTGCSNEGDFTFNIHADVASDKPHGYFGGLVGLIASPQVAVDYDAEYIRVVNCENKGNVTVNCSETSFVDKSSTIGNIFIGGVIGSTAVNGGSETVTSGYAKNYGVLSNLRNSGAVTLNHPGGGNSHYASVAGVIGYAEAYNENCTNSGAVRFANSETLLSAKPAVAGICAVVALSAKDCTNSGDITASGRFGGGSNNYTVTAVGNQNPAVGGCIGVVGVDGKEIVNCDNSGKITVTAGMDPAAGSNYCFGGVIGIYVPTAGNVKDCDNTGELVFDSTAKTNDFGGVVGRCKSTISNCTNAGVGNWKSVCLGSNASKDTDNICNAGGVVGYSYKAVSGCENKAGADLTLESNCGTRFGGVIGMQGAGSGSVSGCINRADVTVNKNIANADVRDKANNLYCGGVVACVNVKMDVVDCENFGDVDATLVAKTAASFIGGVAGYSNGSKSGDVVNVTGCKNHGDVTVDAGQATTQMFVAGVLGDNKGADTKCKCVLDNCFNEGNISLTNSKCTGSFVYVGGVHGGYASSGPSVNNSENRGNVTCISAAKARVGGVSGAVNSEFKNNTQASTVVVTMRNTIGTSTSTCNAGVLAGYCSATKINGSVCNGSLVVSDCTNASVGVVFGNIGATGRTWGAITVDATATADQACGYFAGEMGAAFTFGTEANPFTFKKTTAINGTPIPAEPAEDDLVKNRGTNVLTLGPINVVD